MRGVIANSPYGSLLGNHLATSPSEPIDTAIRKLQHPFHQLPMVNDPNAANFTSVTLVFRKG